MKKGFTLIELLAVIIILAIIASITTISVLSIINESRDKSYKQSANNYIKAVNTAIINENTKRKFSPNICNIQPNGNLLCDNDTKEFVVDIDGNVPESGILMIQNRKVINFRNILFDETYITKNKNNNEIIISETPTPFCSINRKVEGKYTVGDLVTCGEENFYVIENQDTDTTEGIDMLTAKKINVDLTNPVQSDSAGETEFALNEYWTNTENAYIYNSESNVHQYVEAYRDVLEGTGMDVLDAKLISTDQLLSFSDCSLEGGWCDDPEWVYIPGYYWTGNGFYDGYYNIYLVSDYAISTDNHWESDSGDVYWPKAGIRPLITIPTYEIESN